jgi:hypothetical protein
VVALGLALLTRNAGEQFTAGGEVTSLQLKGREGRELCPPVGV